MNTINKLFKDKTPIEQYLVCFVPIALVIGLLYALFGTVFGLLGFSITAATVIIVLLIVNAVKKKKTTNS
jgi:hypothetical protein